MCVCVCIYLCVCLSVYVCVCVVCEHIFAKVKLGGSTCIAHKLDCDINRRLKQVNTVRI